MEYDLDACGDICMHAVHAYISRTHMFADTFLHAYIIRQIVEISLDSDVGDCDLDDLEKMREISS